MKISGGQSLPALSSATADSALHEMLFSGGVLNKRLPELLPKVVDRDGMKTAAYPSA
jgi:hypothetical protein